MNRRSGKSAVSNGTGDPQSDPKASSSTISWIDPDVEDAGLASELDSSASSESDPEDCGLPTELESNLTSLEARQAGLAI
jgi:hypothetical protein